MSKIPNEEKLEKYKEGAIFVGWTNNHGETIISADDLSKMTFDKNMELYPVWKTKINIDANGGKFENGSTVFSTYIYNFGRFDKEPSEPTLEGDGILGLSYKRTGGNIYEGEMLTEETTLYVQWKNYRPTSGEGIAEQEPEVEAKPDLGEKDDTPKTGDDMLISNIALLIEGFVIVLAIIVKKVYNKQ